MTKEVFDEIAPGWYGFRHWSIFTSELEALAQRWQKGKLLNIGCGHGADFLPFKERFALYGVDYSSEMLRFARKYAQKFHFAANLLLADATRLPFRDEAFDWAIAVATYHHVKGQKERQLAFAELKRVLKVGGEAFITVWNRGQPRFWFQGREVAVPWRTKDKTLYRYYYLFSYAEVEQLVKKAGFTVLKSFPESSYHFLVKSFSRNVCLLVKRKE